MVREIAEEIDGNKKGRSSPSPLLADRGRDPYKFFISGMRSPYTRNHYERWLGLFFASIDPPLEGDTLQEQCVSFVRKARSAKIGDGLKNVSYDIWNF